MQQQHAGVSGSGFVAPIDREDRAPSAIAHRRRASKSVGIVLSAHFELDELVSVAQVFNSANALSESCARTAVHYDVCLLSASGGMVVSTASACVWTNGINAHRQPEDFHALFLLGGAGARGGLHDDRVIEWLDHAIPDCVALFPITTARARKPTTEPRCSGRGHMRAAVGSDAACGFSAASPYPDTASSFYAALNLINRDMGAVIAKQIEVAVAPSVDTPFTPIVRLSENAGVSAPIQASARWIAANGHLSIAIDEAARIATMSERNLLRRFKSEVGVTPSHYLTFVRLDKCCRLLVDTDLPVDKIAYRSGIGGGGKLAKLFRAHLEITPTEYRANQRLRYHGIDCAAG
ncbi:helix-turn-helix domain-containing protein [Burkholderia sp. Ac-20353]|uniref:helix-turn-helix domain-containing protein n=1 Tax=Burkholderia sp. Ac-20353 TaxID=2703894 RepID=UPI00197B12D1|nr:helix-turn-helix domain-containing protein [Burkholderia sp. Ac-20353]MBN3788793.1 helix-turn-helix domain-containing protein [Burkholderia sp. Ac-20353]